MPWARTRACATEISPLDTAWAVAVSGPRNRARAVRTALGGGAGAHAQSASQPRGSRGSLFSKLGAGGPADVRGGEFLEPVTFKAAQQPLQLQYPLRHNRVR